MSEHGAGTSRLQPGVSAWGISQTDKAITDADGDHFKEHGKELSSRMALFRQVPCRTVYDASLVRTAATELAGYGCGPYVTCPLPPKRIRAASTVIKPGYSVTTRELLRRRCKLFEQRAQGRPIRGEDGRVLSERESNFARYTLSGACTSCCPLGTSRHGFYNGRIETRELTYKRKNKPFSATQAVESSAFTLSKSVKAATQAAADPETQQLFGKATAYAQRYGATTSPPFTMKTKYDCCTGGTGIRGRDRAPAHNKHRGGCANPPPPCGRKHQGLLFRF